MTTTTTHGLSLALLEIGNLTPALLVTDRCLKAAGVHLLGIESTDGPEQCIKLVGSTAEVMVAAEQGAELARLMGSTALVSVLPAPLEIVRRLADSPPVFSPLLGLYDYRQPRQPPEAVRPGFRPMSEANASTSPGMQDSPQKEWKIMSDAIGLLETQGLVAALHAADDMLKSSNVTLAGKEKIGAAYVTIMVKGDVAAVQTAIETGKRTVERLGGKLILADVIARPHPELAALLPK
ncbi:MAG: BMC domain-containing protein [Planctomycetales bacterium]|nr:BMC domain-containing protein [Planctomycetales bacterium]